MRFALRDRREQRQAAGLLRCIIERTSWSDVTGPPLPLRVVCHRSNGRSSGRARRADFGVSIVSTIQGEHAAQLHGLAFAKLEGSLLAHAVGTGHAPAEQLLLRELSDRFSAHRRAELAAVLGMSSASLCVKEQKEHSA